MKSLCCNHVQDISGNALEDISCLADLPHLLSIKADHNRLSTAQLQELQYLQIASFAHNRIVSTEGVAHPLLHLLDLSCKKFIARLIEPLITASIIEQIIRSPSLLDWTLANFHAYAFWICMQIA